jgi:hypothetical protein
MPATAVAMLLTMMLTGGGVRRCFLGVADPLPAATAGTAFTDDGVDTEPTGLDMTLPFPGVYGIPICFYFLVTIFFSKCATIIIIINEAFNPLHFVETFINLWQGHFSN